MLPSQDAYKRRYLRMKFGVIGASKVIGKAFPGWRMGFVTATYEDSQGWASKHISQLVKSYREWGRARGLKFPYVWVCEIQRKRFYQTGDAVPHYHMLIWLPKGLTPPKPDKQGWWNHGYTNVKFVRQPVHYMTKYLSKEPVDADSSWRLWGCGGITMAMKRQIAWYTAPSWLRKLVPEGHEVRKEGQWWDNLTYKIGYRSPYRINVLTGIPEFEPVKLTYDDVRFL